MVVRPLQRGSTGTLYVAEQLSTAKMRALKVLHREFLTDPTLLGRFEREAQVAARIPSEHVAETVAAGVDRKLDVPWMAMELLEGQSLAGHVDENGPMSAERVRGVLEQVCHALGAAHRLGVVHRDLKPANIFLSSARRVGVKEVVKVLDFGVAKILAEALTIQRTPLGTPSWMAPEQVFGDTTTTATDVWGVGLIAFYMLTGRPFWLEHARSVVVRQILHDPIPTASLRARELGSGRSLPARFDDWFGHCVARTPARRFVTAGAAYAALATVLA